jgi:hypothetical protein
MNGKLEGYSPKANIADCLEQKRKVNVMVIQVLLYGVAKK